MTPQEKAKELVGKYHKLKLEIWTAPRTMRFFGMTKADAIRCAIICVEEILALKLIEDKDLQETTKEYWQDVLTELNKL